MTRNEMIADYSSRARHYEAVSRSLPIGSQQHTHTTRLAKLARRDANYLLREEHEETANLLDADARTLPIGSDERRHAIAMAEAAEQKAEILPQTPVCTDPAIQLDGSYMVRPDGVVRYGDIVKVVQKGRTWTGRARGNSPGASLKVRVEDISIP